MMKDYNSLCRSKGWRTSGELALDVEAHEDGGEVLARDLVIVVEAAVQTALHHCRVRRWNQQRQRLRRQSLFSLSSLCNFFFS